MACKSDGKIKYKGRFEIDKDYHKDNSFKIISLALSDYFFKDIPIERTIKEHTNIYDFCGRQKFKHNSHGETHKLMYDENGQAFDKVQIQQKNTRYYISNPGWNFVKIYAKGTTEQINKGYEVTIFNKYEKKDMKDYNINYQFYINECMKEIRLIKGDQLELF